MMCSNTRAPVVVARVACVARNNAADELPAAAAENLPIMRDCIVRIPACVPDLQLWLQRSVSLKPGKSALDVSNPTTGDRLRTAVEP